MLTTLTPNPSIDRTLRVAALRGGEVHRAEASSAEAGGKGINVARALARAGHEVAAVAPMGASDTASFQSLLGVPASFAFRPVEIGGALRTNVSIVEPDGTTTKVNESGPNLSPADAEQMVAAVLAHASTGEWVAGCGSLPPGVDSDFYAVLAEAARGAGMRVAIDASGEALRSAVEAGCDLIKPNREELAALVASDLSTIGDVVSAARSVIGDGAALVSLGGDGAMLVSAHEALHARAAGVEVRNTVGAGDATLAGFLHAVAGDAQVLSAHSLVTAVQWGSAAVASITTAFDPPRSDARGDTDASSEPVSVTATATPDHGYELGDD